MDHELRVVIASSPIAPSVVQQHAATAETRWSQKPLEVMKPGELRQALRDWSPDCVLLAATGPVVEWVADMAAALPAPPVLLTGIPGMALPARRRGLRFRRRVHGWIVHSLRKKPNTRRSWMTKNSSAPSSCPPYRSCHADTATTRAVPARASTGLCSPPKRKSPPHDTNAKRF